jgi:hypothetical protein
MTRVPSELQEQIALAAWLDNTVGERGWLHVPNEGIRDPAVGARLRKAGLKRGAPDVLIFVRAPEGDRPTAIELKKRDGSRLPTDAQKLWLQSLSALGWYTQVCYGAADAVAYLEGLGYGR